MDSSDLVSEIYEIHSGHCVAGHTGNVSELSALNCALCSSYIIIAQIYSQFTRTFSQTYNDTYTRHGFKCVDGHEFFISNATEATGICPVCDVIWCTYNTRCEEVIKAKTKKSDGSIDVRSRKKEYVVDIPKELSVVSNLSASALDHGSNLGYKTTMALIEKTITEVKPPMFIKVPACTKTQSINTFVNAEQHESDLEYVSGAVYDVNSLLRWKCKRLRHNPYCTNRKCMLLVAQGSGTTARDESCNDLVPCNCTFVASIHTMCKHKHAIECNIDHRIKSTPMIYEAIRIFECIFGVDFSDQYDSTDRVNDKYKFAGYCPKYKIGFRVHAAKDSAMDKYCVSKGISYCMIPKAASNMDQVIIHIIDWIYNIKMNLQKRFAGTDVLIANIDRLNSMELVRRLMHIYNRRHVLM